ncbi:hypothetical protein GGX14DRAFT_392716 [Mycena pura]|uniref:Uncharacterized protein n=1 Tax=Mycena pura TaxID=153505 RepID=A0AAD6VM15_9AGAR|nr:hypothetical protein GGX14DRAFT_392716 [Mycena pura]
MQPCGRHEADVIGVALQGAPEEMRPVAGVCGRSRKMRHGRRAGSMQRALATRGRRSTCVQQAACGGESWVGGVSWASDTGSGRRAPKSPISTAPRRGTHTSCTAARGDLQARDHLAHRDTHRDDVPNRDLVLASPCMAEEVDVLDRRHALGTTGSTIGKCQDQNNTCLERKCTHRDIVFLHCWSASTCFLYPRQGLGFGQLYNVSLMLGGVIPRSRKGHVHKKKERQWRGEGTDEGREGGENAVGGGEEKAGRCRWSREEWRDACDHHVVQTKAAWQHPLDGRIHGRHGDGNAPIRSNTKGHVTAASLFAFRATSDPNNNNNIESALFHSILHVKYSYHLSQAQNNEAISSGMKRNEGWVATGKHRITKCAFVDTRNNTSRALTSVNSAPTGRHIRVLRALNLPFEAALFSTALNLPFEAALILTALNLPFEGAELKPQKNLKAPAVPLNTYLSQWAEHNILKYTMSQKSEVNYLPV